MNKNYNLGLSMAVVLLILVGGLFLFSKDDSPVTGSAVMDNPILDNSGLAGNPDKITIYFFWGDGCPHCEDEKPFLEGLEQEYGDKIEVKMFETWKNKENVKLFQEAAAAHGIQARGVPTTFIGEKHWIGYSDYMALEMESYIQKCINEGCEDPLAN